MISHHAYKNTNSFTKLLFCISSGVYEFADSHSCQQLAQSAFTYSVNHFNEVLQTDKFCLISIDHVNKLLADNALNVPSEERVFEAAIAWIEYDKENRMVCLLYCLIFHVVLQP